MIFLFVCTSVIPTALTTINIASTDSCDIPTWCIGDEWVYTADPVSYYSDNGSFDGKIENLKREVVNITTITHDDEQIEVYQVDITGDITGELSWGLLSGDLEGIVEGVSYIRVSDLAEVKTEIVSTGIVQILFIDQDYELINTNLFLPPLELYDFPLKLYDQWDISCNILTSGSFTIESLVDEEYSESDILDETVQCNDKEIVSVPAGDFDCYKITYPSDTFWYSPKVGNLVKSEVEQRSRDNTFNMDLSLESFQRGIQPINVTENIDPSEALIDQEINISGQAVDSNGDPIQNGDISVEIPRIGESWSTSTDENGYYTITIEAPYIIDDTPSEGEFGSDGVIVRCTSGNLEGYKVKTLLIIDEFLPYPPIVDGPTSGKTGKSYDYIFNAIDPEGNFVKYIIDWGDGNTDTTPFNQPGTDVTVSHIWSTAGTYYIKAKSKDTHDAESDWSNPLMMIITKNKNRVINTPFLNSLEDHPNLFLILQKIIQSLEH